MKNKHFYYYCTLTEKFCLDQGSCTSAASIRWGLVGKNTLSTLQRATLYWHLRGKLTWDQPIMSADVSRWTSSSPQLFILPSCVFPGTSHLWRRRDTCLCLAWWDPGLHCSMCTLWRHKTKARRFGGHCAEKSEPSHQWDLTKAELVPNFWDSEVPCLAGNGQQCWHEDTGSAALTFTWWGLFMLLHGENESSPTHTNCTISWKHLTHPEQSGMSLFSPHNQSNLFGLCAHVCVCARDCTGLGTKSCLGGARQTLPQGISFSRSSSDHGCLNEHNKVNTANQIQVLFSSASLKKLVYLSSS